MTEGLALSLDPAQLEGLADLIAERLAEQTRTSGLVDARAVARFLSVEESYVYEHAAELGARRLGTGPKARLRFSLRDVDERVSCLRSRESTAQEVASAKASRRRRTSPLGTSVPLLPIRGQKGPRKAVP